MRSRKARVFLFITAGRGPRLPYANEADVMLPLGARTPPPSKKCLHSWEGKKNAQIERLPSSSSRLNYL